MRSTEQALTPYAGPWDRRRATHLIRRQGFGALKREVDQALNDGSATAAVARLVETAQTDPLPEPPAWYQGGGSSEVEEVYDLQRSWFEAMRTRGLIEKMTLFWTNHFAVQWSVNQGKASNSASHLTYDYYRLLRLHALGNFRTLVHNIGRNAAMLVYLDGFVNEVGHANENYARELLELFTMGLYAPDGAENYTEADIKELARALTGWVVTGSNGAAFDPARHDGGAKTIFGHTAAFDYDAALDLIFDARADAIAVFVCRKLYCFFVQPMPHEAVVRALADVFLANDFEIAPVLQTLLGSDHFYQDTFIASRIKSPLELIIGFLREAELTPTRDLLEAVREMLAPTALNQEPFNPPNVAGWPGLNPPAADNQPGHYAWLTTGTLPDRWQHLDALLNGEAGATYDPFDLVQKRSDPSDPLRIPADLAEAFLPIPLHEAGIHDLREPFGGNPEFPPPPQFLEGPAHAVNLTKIMLNGTPHYEWPRFDEQNPAHVAEARELLRRYITYLVHLPEYQLT